MAATNLVALLKQGVTAWNAWRATHDPPDGDPKWETLFLDLSRANLAGVELTDADLSNCDLTSADLRGAKLSQVQLGREECKRADLVRADLRGALIDGTDFSYVNLTGALFEGSVSNSSFAKAQLFHADFTAVKLAHADFSESQMRKTILKDAYLFNANMTGAFMKEAVLTGADLTQANLTAADLTETDFSNATIKGTNLKNTITQRAIFAGAWVEDAKHLTFDSSLTRGAAFPTTSHDPWSVLRRNYTGSHLLFHLLFLIATLIPYVGRTAAWLLVNRVQTVAVEESAKLQEQKGITLGDGAISVTFDDKTLKRIANAQTCLAANCTETRVWKILLGLDRPFPFWVLPLCSGLWGIMRTLLIFEVTPLSDLEDRSGFSPAWRGRHGYQWLYYLHLVSWLPWGGAISSLIYELASWLGKPVWLPS